MSKIRTLRVLNSEVRIDSFSLLICIFFSMTVLKLSVEEVDGFEVKQQVS